MQDGLCDRAPFEAGLLAATSAALAFALINAPVPGARHFPSQQIPLHS